MGRHPRGKVYPFKKAWTLRYVGDAVGRCWEDFWDIFGGCVGRCLGHVWEVLKMDVERFLDSIREGLSR